ncbi:ankyrin repeat and SAM domain-containing protein 3-like [Dreissena polymorpha]|uniref:ankyrin repeat and SAM domain-containing protein 3-like n=1 Tax=Dreissena polymorpha TaxID=45954 RepID=UPI0022641768|nr:ankyrin repeat and SAM domain-containing protein 3-like [Dreissena polymorpha]
MAETEGSDDTSENELLNRSLSVWKGNKEVFEPVPLDLHTASSLGLVDCVKVHINSEGIEIDRFNKGGWTALMYACYIGHESIVSILIDRGASVNLRNSKKETALMLAASCGNDRVGRLLCNQGAELEYQDQRGWTALFHATYSGHQNMVAFLLKQGANMNAIESQLGMTPFMEAAAEGHEIILQLFLRHGVNVNAKAYNGDTARSLALINGNMKIVSLIDNHVMPITSLRAEPELGSSLDTLSRTKNSRIGRGKGMGGGPSIMDGPQAIARLIDRTGKDVGPLKPPDVGVVPKGFVTFPEGETSDGQPTKLSYRDVTSPINPEDYKLDSSGSRVSEFNEVEDDSNMFSKTGALTIKSSSGSSGGLAAAFGIIREDSMDSDEFPRDSSCGDSHHHGNSTESSSDSGSEENLGQRAGNLEVDKCQKGQSGDKRRDISKKSKELRLTTEKVSEIKVMKNSVSEWIDSVQDTHPVPENNFDFTEEGDKDEAIKPEYQPKQRSAKSNDLNSGSQAQKLDQISSQLQSKLCIGSDLIDQVANNVKNHDPRPAKEFLPNNIDQLSNAVTSLNMYKADGFGPLDNHHYHGNQVPRVPPPPGFTVPVTGPFVTPNGAIFAQGANSVSVNKQASMDTCVEKSPVSSNAAFMEKMSDCTPNDLGALLEGLGLSKYLTTFEEQDVDLQVFLSLNDNDLKEIGIKLFGPRKKMMNAIARWHGKARISMGELEQVYADRLEGEMQEMGAQLQLALEQLEKLKAQVKQEQQLRNVTESCLMEERGAWQQVQRIVMDTRQQCEDFKDAIRKLATFVAELKARVSMETNMQGQGHKGQGRVTEDTSPVPIDRVIRKVDHYMQEIQHLLSNVTANTDRLLGRNAHADSPDRGYT